MSETPGSPFDSNLPIAPDGTVTETEYRAPDDQATRGKRTKTALDPATPDDLPQGGYAVPDDSYEEQEPSDDEDEFSAGYENHNGKSSDFPTDERVPPRMAGDYDVEANGTSSRGDNDDDDLLIDGVDKQRRCVKLTHWCRERAICHGLLTYFFLICSVGLLALVIYISHEWLITQFLLAAEQYKNGDAPPSAPGLLTSPSQFGQPSTPVLNTAPM
jgi:hypothetical protein